MGNFNTDFERYQRAKKQVAEIKGFYIHLLWFIVGNGICIFINLKYSPEHLWFFWPLLGWGIGLLSHAAKTFNWFPFFSKQWEEQKIKEFMEQENNEQKKYQ